MSETQTLGEVIASDSRLLEVECHRLYCAPAFGAFVRVDCVGSGVSQFGVVTHVSTGPFDGNRVVQAHRMPPGELEQRKPHLNSLLRTTFQARVVGFTGEGGVSNGTPRQPARLHCFVYAATPEEVRSVTGSSAFLRPLVDTPDAPLEDLLVCAMEAAREAWGAEAPILAWGKYLARLLQQDYVTLEGVLQRISPPAPSPVPAATAELRRAPKAGTERLRSTPIYEEPLPIAGRAPGSDPFENI